MTQRTPLAWKNLIHLPGRFALSCGAIGFAVVLMFMQSGFRNALLDSPIQIIERLGGDLVAISPARYALASEQRFPSRLLQRVANHPDVVGVVPVYIERSTAMLRTPGSPSRNIRVIGLPAESGQVADPQLDAMLPLLSQPRTAIIDQRSKKSYQIPVHDPEALAATDIELMNRSLRIVGRVEIGADFAHDGNLIVGEHSVKEYFPFRGDGDPLSIVDLGIIRLRKGADQAAVVRDLQQVAPQEMEVLSRKNVEQRERDFWETKTPIGIIFTAGMMVGFAVGVIICYQILFTEIHDHMAEFATLKAMGYKGNYFVTLVCQQAWLLATFGFLPGFAVSWGLFSFLESAVDLPMSMTPLRVMTIFVLTVAMCTVGGLLAMRKLLGADPAKLF